jgi:type II secretory ATPase GspE/PulE/Tfp pilus assembly ATPase PilB-like protein
MIIAGAMQAGSSDIHIEAEEYDIVVRYRIDGILQSVATLKKELWPRIISRVKSIAKLKINIEDIPQDGRITVFLGKGQEMDIRVSTLPSAYGESIVMRLLMSSLTGFNFDDLGIRGRAFEQLKRETERPNGMIITTGPTGSGKSTTLYAILSKLNEPGVKIITLEDPIEIKIKGITQSQIDHSKDYTFVSGLRSILRQDPDIVMVGEIRDIETAEISIQAALTGHLVLSTIHTNDAAGAIPRFLSMGVKPFLLAPALNAVVGQRLVRRICQACKVEDKLDDTTMARVKDILSQIPENSGFKADLKKLKFYKGAGCEECNGLGFKGRIGIYEVFTMNPDVEKLILSGSASEYQMRDVAVKHGMITMVQDGLLKALDGITSVEEVFSAAE